MTDDALIILHFCPFCAAQPYLEHLADAGVWDVGCPQCPALMSDMDHDTVVAAWNHRVVDAAATADEQRNALVRAAKRGLDAIAQGADEIRAQLLRMGERPAP